jgi:hypothetical protein
MIFRSDHAHVRFYTSGAYIIPQEVTFDDGTVVWRWIVDEFNDDTFNDDGEYVSVNDAADTAEGLINFDESEE